MPDYSRMAIDGRSKAQFYKGKQTSTEQVPSAYSKELITDLARKGMMRLKAVLGRAIPGEVLHRENHRALVQALFPVLIAPDQFLDDTHGDLGPLTVGAAVSGPAGVGGHVHLGTVHDVLARRLHHLPVGPR